MLELHETIAIAIASSKTYLLNAHTVSVSIMTNILDL